MTRDTKLILGVTGGSHLSVHALMLVLPSILLVIQKEFQVGLDVLGFIVAASTFMFGLGAIPAGLLERRVGGRNLLIVYQAGSALSAIVVIMADSLTMFTVGMMLVGSFASLYHPAGLTLISRRVKNLSKVLGIHGVAGTSGLAIGPILAASLTDLVSWRAAFAVLVVVNLLLAVATSRLIPPRKQLGKVEDDAQNTYKTNRPALFSYYTVIVFIGLAFAGFTTFMPTHFSLNAARITEFLSNTIRGGLFTTIVLVGGVFGQVLGGYLGERISYPKLFGVLLFFNMPLLILIGYTTDIPLILISIVFGVVHFAMQPAGNAMIASFTHSSSRGIGYGINFFLNFGVGSIGAAIAGYVAEYFAVNFVFPVMGLILIPGLFLAYRLNKLFVAQSG